MPRRRETLGSHWTDPALRELQSDDLRPASRQSRHALPANLPPLGLCRVAASQYIGISVSKFDQLVDDGRMPAAKRIDGRKVWHRVAIERAFEQLPDDGPDPLDNPWDAVA